MPKQPVRDHFSINGPAGRLEAVLELPAETSPVGCAVVCHPHPLHGGTMQNKVAHTLARGFLAVDFAALRFNFRGVGASDGSFDDGIGEVQDALAAITWLRKEMPGLPLWLSGFSFGAGMSVRAAVERSPDGLVSIAPAVSRFVGELEHQPDCPWLIVLGDKDELVDVDETIAWINELEPGPELEVFAGAEHFFHGRLVELREAVAAFVRENSGASEEIE